MAIFIFVLIIIVCVLLALIVLIQNPKGGGLDSSYASVNQIGGVKRTADFLEKSTWTLAISLFVLCLVSAGIQGGAGTFEAGSIYEETELAPPPAASPEEGAAEEGAAEEIPAE